MMDSDNLSRISVESLESQSTLRSDDHDHADSVSYNEIDDDSLFADFKMPDLSVSKSLFILILAYLPLAEARHKYYFYGIIGGEIKSLSNFLLQLCFLSMHRQARQQILQDSCFVTVKTLNIGTPRPATVVVHNIKQFNFTMK